MSHRSLVSAGLLVVVSVFIACSETQPSPASAAGSAAGGAAGATDGGASNGGASNGGIGEAGSSNGGIGEAGSSWGGLPSGGVRESGAGAGGSPLGGGGAADSGGGEGGAAPRDTFILGADISSVQESSLTYRDVDGTEKPLLEILKNHGFNYVRLKTFVDPSAPYGYASSANGCDGLPEPFGDRDHVIAAGKQAKEAGMGLLLDLHYSDVWADPGNQIIPQAWRGAKTIGELAAFAKAYTKDVIGAAVSAGARPDMVQIGNEITPGMLMHVPGPSTDCWGNYPASAPFGGSSGTWENLATLLKAGIEGVREVDPSIRVMLHIENTDDLSGVRWWVDNAVSHGVSFDVLGLSCYVTFQGPPSGWKRTFLDMAMRYPKLRFAIAEYNAERTQANLMIRDLPDGRGLGTFFWEPTRSGEWGSALFDLNDGTATAREADFAELDALAPQLGL
jgi:arabinogalactan endo-1,4-beta-galactosidase